MKEIPLTKGAVALVDDEDYDELIKFKWHVNAFGYAVRKPHSGKGKSFYMHREVMKTPDDMSTDHIDGNKLNNRKINLRICSTSQNMGNRGKQKNNTSGYKGVFWSEKAGRWRAQITYKKKAIHIGLFDKPIEAAKAYNEEAVKYFGIFAKLNEV